ncbi:hypothetical protein ACTXJ1_10975 [Brachybacterium alimentarium]|uniref:hypothetical protein n=1 Tax=Brachybacterium alimentarium TaxID=47845 RepID=UPI003FB688C4
MSDRPGRGASEGDTGALSASEHLTGERDGSEHNDAPDSAEPQATTPLASLTSLLGDDVAGGASCAADGTCD